MGCAPDAARCTWLGGGTGQGLGHAIGWAWGTSRGTCQASLHSFILH